MKIIDKSQVVPLGELTELPGGIRIFVPYYMMRAYKARIDGASWGTVCLVALGGVLAACVELEAEYQQALTDKNADYMKLRKTLRDNANETAEEEEGRN